MTVALTSAAVELVGLELEIANIAHSSGFNCTNHKALFDLIWAVKRTAFKIKPPGPTRPPPPPHPIYPDRYRPCGKGDNTNKKRKRTDDVKVKFYPAPSLMQRGGTREAPINLDSDDDKENIPPPTKKTRNTRSATETRQPENAVTDKVLDVKKKLEAVIVQVNGCQAEMKLLFDRYRDDIDDDLLTLFENLADAMNQAFDAAHDAGR